MATKDTDIIEIDILYMLRALVHHIWLIILCAAICSASGFFLANNLLPAKYTASTMIYVSNSNEAASKGETIESGDLSAAQSLVETYLVILETPATLNSIIREAGVNIDTEDFLGMIDSSSENKTEIFKIDITSTNPDEAIKLANATATILPTRIQEIVDGSSVRTVQSAEIAPRTGPDRKMFTLVGALIGLLLSALFVVIKELADDTIYSEEQINDICMDVPVLAVIPDLFDTSAFSKNYYYGKGYKYMGEPDKRKKKKTDTKNLTKEEKEQLVMCENLDFAALESYKVLRTNLNYNLGTETGCKVIGITSSNSQEGKSTTSINLSYVFAQAGMKVITIEGDLRLPTITKRLGTHSNTGLTDLVRGEFDSTVIAPSGKLKNWNIISAGTRTASPSEILGSDQIGRIMTILKKKYDIILVDLPPVNEVVDATAMAPYLDGMVFVVKSRSTKKVAFQMALRQLNLSGVPLSGFVLVNSDGSGGRYGKYGKYGKYGAYQSYYYGSNYQAADQRRSRAHKDRDEISTTTF